MRSKIYSFVLADTLPYRNYKIRNNRLALALKLLGSLCTYKNTDKHLQALSLPFEIRNRDK